MKEAAANEQVSQTQRSHASGLELSATPNCAHRHGDLDDNWIENSGTPFNRINRFNPTT